MNQINFLPESYRRSQQRRGRMLRQAVLVLSVAGCLVLAAIVAETHSRSERLHAERLEDTVKSEQVTLGALAEIEHDHAALLNRARLRQELEPAVMYSQVIAALSKAMPEEVAVTGVEMLTVKPKPEPKETEAQREARKRRSSRHENKDVVYEPYLIQLEIDGLAPDDVSVAMLVAALDEHPLFSRVTMRSSRTTNTQGLQAREFSLTATIDLDREFDWIEPSSEVAHAD